MKRLLLLILPCLLAFGSFSKLSGQVGNNLTVLSNWDDNSLPATSNLIYNEVWGWADSLGREYAIIGSLERSYFIEVTNPTNPIVRDSVEGAYDNCIHRDYKTYGKYCYAVADEGNSTLQIIDLSYLPDSVHVVYDSDQFFKRCHDTYIDSVAGRLYAVGTNTRQNGVIILDIATNPANPTLLADNNLGVYTHDLYVRGDTAYMNNGFSGLAIYDMAIANSPVQIGALTSYPQQGYNHSCWLTEDGNSLVMLDETRNISCKIVDVSNLGNINIASMFRSANLGPADTGSIAHNPLIAGNYATISYYHDGVQIWDISNPAAPVHVAGYDTEPSNTDYNGWKGTWGVYPFLPSGTILASDVVNGLFVFRAPFPFPHAITAQTQAVAATCSNTNISNGSASVTPAGGTQPYSYLWNTGDTTSSISGVGPGTYTVTISDRYNYNIVDTIQITGPAPIAQTIGISNESCSGTANGAIDLNVSGGTGNFSYQWSTGDMIQDINGLTAGWYYVTITDGAGCIVLDSAQVTSLAPTPQAIAGQDSFLCNANIQLWAQTPALGTGQWQWINGSGNIQNPSLPNSSVSNLQQGQSQLVWIVTAGQCAGADTLNIAVSSAAFTAAGQDTFFCGTDMQLSASSAGNGVGTWSTASNPINFSGASDPNAIAQGLMPGSYTVIWTVNDANCTASDSFNLNVAHAPVAAFGQSVTALTATFTDMSQNTSNWAWDFGDGNTSSAQNPVHNYATNGLYDVCLTVTDTCGSDTTCQQVNIFVVGMDGPSLAGLRVWPNPFQSNLRLEIEGLPAESFTLQMFDLYGKQILEQEIQAQQGTFQGELEVPNIADGIYFLQLSAGDWKQSIKLLHQSK